MAANAAEASYSSLFGFSCVSYDDHPRAFYQVVNDCLDFQKGINGALISALAFQFFAHSKLTEKKNIGQLSSQNSEKNENEAQLKSEEKESLTVKPRLLILKHNSNDENNGTKKDNIIAAIVQIPTVLFISEFDNLQEKQESSIYAKGSHNQSPQTNDSKMIKKYRELVELITLNLHPIDDNMEYEISGNLQIVEMFAKQYRKTMEKYGKYNKKNIYFDDISLLSNDKNKENSLFYLKKLVQNVYCLTNSTKDYNIWVENELKQCKLKIDKKHKIYDKYFGHFILADSKNETFVNAIKEWYPIFCKDVGLPHTESGEQRMLQLIKSGHGYFWAIEPSTEIAETSNDTSNETSNETSKDENKEENKDGKNETKAKSSKFKITIKDETKNENIQLELVSFAAITGFTPKIARIGFVFTPQEHRGHGYATHLVAHVCEAMEKQNKLVYIIADNDNPASNKCYKRVGFKLIDNQCVLFIFANHKSSQPQ